MTWTRFVRFDVVLATFFAIACQHGVWGLCTNGTITISADINSPCAGENWHILCLSPDPIVSVYRNEIEIYNGSSVTTALFPRVYITTNPLASECYFVFINFTTLRMEDMGAYTCRSNSSSSDSLQVDPNSGPSSTYPVCTLNTTTGSIVREGDAVQLTCLSEAGRPPWGLAWNGIANTSVLQTGEFITSVAAIQVTSSTVTDIFTCTATPPATDACPSSPKTCHVDFNQLQLRIVTDPVASYIDLNPTLALVQLGGSQTFTCQTSLPGTTVELTPNALLAPNQYTISSPDDSTAVIVVSNMTTNLTEPVVSCSLIYLQEHVITVHASLIVLPLEIPSVTSEVATTMRTTSSPPPTTVLMTSGVQTEQPSNLTTGSLDTMNASTPYLQTTTRRTPAGNYGGVSITALAVGLSCGFIAFLGIAICIVVILTKLGRAKGGVTFNTKSAKRRGQAEIAGGDGFEGRLEWETDTNPLVLETTMADCPDTDRSPSGSPLDLGEDHSQLNPFANGAPALRVDAIIENHNPIFAFDDSYQQDTLPRSEGESGLDNTEFDQEIQNDNTFSNETDTDKDLPKRKAMNGQISRAEEQQDTPSNWGDHVYVTRIFDSSKEPINDDDSGLNLNLDFLSDGEEGVIDIVTV